MKRDEWTRMMAVTEVLGAAQDRMTHHEARAAYWRKELQGAQQRADEERRTYDLDAAGRMGLGNNVSSTYNSIANANDQRIQACRIKVSEHEGKVREYRSWVRFLRIFPDDMVPVVMDDYQFFGLDEREVGR